MPVLKRGQDLQLRVSTPNNPDVAGYMNIRPGSNISLAGSDRGLRGFTLIELLVVTPSSPSSRRCSSPALTQARQKAQGIYCMIIASNSWLPGKCISTITTTISCRPCTGMAREAVRVIRDTAWMGGRVARLD